MSQPQRRRPLPPPPPGKTASASKYYSSNAGLSSSTAARQRLGLNPSNSARGPQNTDGVQGEPPSMSSTHKSTANTATMSSDDWFASTTTPAPTAGSSGPGFYPGYSNYADNSSSGGYYGGGGQPASVPPASAFQTSGSGLSGRMGGPMGGPSTMVPTPNVFDPNSAIKSESANKTMSVPEEDYDNEPPLLEELGVNFPHIYSKSRAVLFPIGKHAKTLEHDVMDDNDLAGPLAFALGLGGELLLSGKMHFGYVYGFGISGWFAMTLLLNLLNPNGAVSAWTVVSILGYALLPVNFLAGVNIILRIGKMGWLGMVLAVLTIGWCTAASTRLFERGCDMRSQRFLVAYPSALLYSAFVMITIF
ncbi:hypothetical protein HJC23_006235 [Cyclotella cryptica]|uniref:Protein YIPF n=1 Tax=Cyclotella cryptica TaxID=29204 RepID=A0ABD3PVW5_9STRA|eukprot:CCRYP_010874-RA/>CCRYP_010874-RA protein AED:0.00 eAED:0.00 QI:70/-1/1/1/-1/1/1/198/361